MKLDPRALSKTTKLICSTLLLVAVSTLSGMVYRAQNANHSKGDPAQQEASLERSVRSVDFLNFTYDWFPEGYGFPDKPHKVTLKDGQMPITIYPGEDVTLPDTDLKVGFSFAALSYCDLTADGVEDAVIILGVEENGSNRPFGVLVYTTKDRSPILIWAHTSGAGGVHGLRDAYVSKGKLILEEYDPWIGEVNQPFFFGGGSPTYSRSYYQWTGMTFEVLNSETVPNEGGYARFRPSRAHDKIGVTAEVQPKTIKAGP